MRWFLDFDYKLCFSAQLGQVKRGIVLSYYFSHYVSCKIKQVNLFWFFFNCHVCKFDWAWSILCINKSICTCLRKQGFININECICK